MHPKEKTIQVGNQTVSYFDEGSSDKAIIFLHGFPFNKKSWTPQIEKLSPHFRTIAYDRRGFGKSTGDISNMSIDQLSTDLLAFADALHLKQFIVCGISMGGYIALHIAGRAAERIKAMILCNTQCIADSEEGKKKRYDSIDQIKKNGLEEYSKKFAEGMLGIEKEGSGQLRSMLANMIKEADPNSVTSMLKGLAERSETCTLAKQLKIPTLVVAGKHDKIIPLSQSELLFNTIGGSEMKTLENAGHLCNLEEPEEFNKLVIDFCSKLS